MSGIYIHIPFCLSKCIYCNFYSSTDLKQREKFLQTIIREMQIQSNYLPNPGIKTLYFGGGTPSLLSIQELEMLIDNLQRYFNLTELEEMTIEINPDSIPLSYLFGLKNIGFNRISIGIQSFHDPVLRLLQRRHTVEEATHTLNNAFNAGFSNVSIDLIYGITERSNALWEEELRRAFSFPVTHLSAYSLTVEENTLLHKKIKRGLCSSYSEELAIANFDTLLRMAEENGFLQYEISNFAKNGLISQHNFAYWQGVPYLGLGPSAHSFNGNSRRWNYPKLTTYIDCIQHRESFFEIENLTHTDLLNEYILLNLRTYKGVDFHYIKENFGEESLTRINDALQNIKKSFYTLQNHHLRLTREGKLFADFIAAELFTIAES